MPRRLVKSGSQVRITGYIDKRCMAALQQIKGKTNYLITDMVREAMSMYVAERARSGMVEMEDGTLPYRDWAGLVRSVAEVLEEYRWKATAQVREHGAVAGFGGDLTEWFYGEIRAVLEGYDATKERVGSVTKTAAKAQVGAGK